MRTAKIAIIGAPSVGKTTLALHFPSQFGPEYGKTVGVMVVRARVPTDEGEVALMLWDIDGGVDAETRRKFCQDAFGFVMVADVTRRETLGAAQDLLREIARGNPAHVSVLFLNKSDSPATHEIDPAEIGRLAFPRTTLVVGSAKTSEGVENVFAHLAGEVARAAGAS